MVMGTPYVFLARSRMAIIYMRQRAAILVWNGCLNGALSHIRFFGSSNHCVIFSHGGAAIATTAHGVPLSIASTQHSFTLTTARPSPSWQTTCSEGSEDLFDIFLDAIETFV